MAIHFKIFKQNLANKAIALGEDVNRDWTIIISAFGLLVIVAILMSGYLFLKVNEGEFFATPKNTTRSIETLNRARLEKTGEKLRARSTEFENARTDQSLFDPSI